MKEFVAVVRYVRPGLKKTSARNVADNAVQYHMWINAFTFLNHITPRLLSISVMRSSKRKKASIHAWVRMCNRSSLLSHAGRGSNSLRVVQSSTTPPKPCDEYNKRSIIFENHTTPFTTFTQRALNHCQQSDVASPCYVPQTSQ